MKRIQNIALICLLVTKLLVSCTNRYNDTIEWMDNLKVGTTLKDVINSQPDFVTVNWAQPDTVNDQLRYNVTGIKGVKDRLAMSHQLVFINNKYVGRESHK